MNKLMNFVYLHGFCSTPDGTKGRYWAERFEEQGVLLHRPDLNGEFEHLTISSQIEIASAVIDSLRGDIAVIGSSMGGYLATLLAEQYQQIRKLVLIAPAFHFPARHLQRMDQDELQQWRETGYLMVEHYGYGEKRRLHYGIIPDALEWDQKPLTREIPALIFHGIFDDAVSYHLSVDYAAQNSLAELHLYNGDHQLHDKLERIWQQIELFLEI